MATLTLTLPVALDGTPGDIALLVEPVAAGVGGGMFPRRFFAARMFAPRFFPTSQGAAPAAPATVLPKRKTMNARRRKSLR